VTSQIKIGTRGSPLALAQANEARRAILSATPALKGADIGIKVIKTSGDIIQDRVLIEEGGKGLFTKEIEDQLLAGQIDLAVHSTKDVPAKLPDGLQIEIFLKREDPRDAFLSPVAGTIADLPRGAVVGTSSLRRQAQVLCLRPDLEVIPFRGNVETRLSKMKAGEVSATLLAAAGLNRLGLAGEITELLDYKDMLPAPGQGAVAIETRTGDKDIMRLLKPVNDADTRLAVRVERAVSLALGASCRMPLAALARVEGDEITAEAALFSPDGKSKWHVREKGPLDNPEGLGKAIGAEILKIADPGILKTYRIF